jgi:hypothetical protein
MSLSLVYLEDLCSISVLQLVLTYLCCQHQYHWVESREEANDLIDQKRLRDLKLLHPQALDFYPKELVDIPLVSEDKEL